MISNRFNGAVFVDRDGVINLNRDDYVKNVDELVFIPGALIALEILNKAGMAVVIISNQAGIARGVIDSKDLTAIDLKLNECVNESGGNIHAIYYCRHKPEDQCHCRKPKPGLILQAIEEMNLAEIRSYLIGDALSDIDAGSSAGCTTILVLSGRTTIKEVDLWDKKPDYIADDLLAAVNWIICR
ncbi:MAG: D-glycero-beta-D-manno-heptose 1,7-bisphosphate 7-phosphatase [Armatimonadota bacterium]